MTGRFAKSVFQVHGFDARGSVVARRQLQDFVYVPGEDVYSCPAGERLTYRYSNEEDGKKLRRYWTTVCHACPLKSKCTTGPERRIPRGEHEHLLDAVQ